MKYAVVDIEGNGGTPPEIIEIAVVLVNDGALTKRKTSLVRPKNKITPRAQRIHGITNDDVVDAPWWNAVASDFGSLFCERVLVAHNANVELRCLSRQRLSYWPPSGYLDTLPIARDCFSYSTYTLQGLLQELKLDPHQHGVETEYHRAEYDAVGTALLLLHLGQVIDLRSYIQPIPEKYGGEPCGQQRLL